MGQELNFERPPAKVPRRSYAWLPIAVVAALFFLVLWILPYPFSQPPNSENFGFAVAIVVGAALAIVWCVQYLYVTTRVSRFMGPGRGIVNGSLDDPNDPGRIADREEMQAARQLRHGEITRTRYELIVTRRQFVHGDITRKQYEDRVAAIAEEEKRTGRVGASRSGGR